MKTLSIGLLSLGLLLAGQVSAQAAKDTVFVGRLQVGQGLASGAHKETISRFVDSLDAQLLSALASSRVFQVLERKRKDDLELEQAYAAVAVNPNDKNAAKALMMAGAKYAFLPRLDGFESRTEAFERTLTGQNGIRTTFFVSIVVQIVDTTTGQVLPDVPSVQLKEVNEQPGKTGGATAITDEAIVTVAKEGASRIVSSIMGALRPATVLALTGKQILINRGTNAGFSVGDTVEIFAVQNVTDEDTGEVFRNEVPVGRARIVRGDIRQTFADIEGEDLGVAKGCIVRVKK